MLDGNGRLVTGCRILKGFRENPSPDDERTSKLLVAGVSSAHEKSRCESHLQRPERKTAKSLWSDHLKICGDVFIKFRGQSEVLNQFFKRADQSAKSFCQKAGIKRLLERFVDC